MAVAGPACPAVTVPFIATAVPEAPVSRCRAAWLSTWPPNVASIAATAAATSVVSATAPTTGRWAPSRPSTSGVRQPGMRTLWNE